MLPSTVKLGKVIPFRKLERTLPDWLDRAPERNAGTVDAGTDQAGVTVHSERLHNSVLHGIEQKSTTRCVDSTHLLQLAANLLRVITGVWFEGHSHHSTRRT